MKNEEFTIINDCLEKMKTVANVKIISGSEQKADMGVDLFIDVINEGGKIVRYAVEVKRSVSGSLAESLLHKLNMLSQSSNIKYIVFTEHISMGIAKKFKEQGVEFVDCTGNMFVDLPWLRVFVMGYQKEDRIKTRISLSSAVALKVIYTILTHTEAIRWTHREIARAAGVALGSVVAVYRELRSQGCLHVRKKNGEVYREIVNKAQLFDKWITGYDDKLRPKLHLGSYRIVGNTSITELPGMLVNINQKQVLIGGELGATLLEKGNLRPGAATLHLGINSDEKSLSLHLKMVPDMNGNVVLLRTFGECNTLSGGEYPFLLANPLLMYAELLQVNDPRAREFAEKFYLSRINGIYNQ